MELIEAIEKRHSVRSYTDKKIEGEVLSELHAEIKRAVCISSLLLMTRKHSAVSKLITGNSAM